MRFGLAEVARRHYDIREAMMRAEIPRTADPDEALRHAMEASAYLAAIRPEPHPRLRTLDQKVRKLTELCRAFPLVQVKWQGLNEDRERFEQLQENTRAALSAIRAGIQVFNGDVLTRVLRMVRRHRSATALTLAAEAQGALERMRMAEQVFMYLLDTDSEEEWLPSQAPPGSFDACEPAEDVVL